MWYTKWIGMAVIYLVLIILRKAPMEVIRVTMCALPVWASVTVITGQENATKSSKELNRCPHERSYLLMCRVNRVGVFQWQSRESFVQVRTDHGIPLL